jgi:hypothetical protein
MRTTGLRRLAAAVSAAAMLAACGDAPRHHGSVAEKVPAGAVPSSFAGFVAEPEDITAQEEAAGPTSYFGSTRLWSIRRGEKLVATLQIGRFVDDADLADEDFRSRVITQIGQVDPRERHLAGTDVHVTATSDQPLYVWLRNRDLMLLSVAKDEREPVRLLRAALELRP